MTRRVKPETLRMARRWAGTESLYTGDGLCHACAAQAAWGHQIGFRRVKPPCAACVRIVATFPVAKSNGWRAFPVGESRAVSDSGDRPVPGPVLSEAERLAELGRLYAGRTRGLRAWIAKGNRAKSFRLYPDMTAREISVAIGWVPWPEKWPA